MDCAALIIFPPRNRGCVSKLFTIEVRPPLSSLAWKIYFSFRLSVSLNLARLFAIGEKTARSALSIFPPPPFFDIFRFRRTRGSAFNAVELFCLRCLVIGKVPLFSLSLCQESSPSPSRDRFPTVFRVEDYNARRAVFSLF